MSHLLSVTCQDAPSFSRWSYIFAYMFACMCITMCICIDFAVKIFCQLPAKLPHLFGRLSYVCVCACVLFVHVDDIYIIIVLKALASILI